MNKRKRVPKETTRRWQLHSVLPQGRSQRESRRGRERGKRDHEAESGEHSEK